MDDNNLIEFDDDSLDGESSFEGAEESPQEEILDSPDITSNTDSITPHGNGYNPRRFQGLKSNRNSLMPIGRRPFNRPVSRPNSASQTENEEGNDTEQPQVDNNKKSSFTSGVSNVGDKVRKLSEAAKAIKEPKKFLIEKVKKNTTKEVFKILLPFFPFGVIAMGALFVIIFVCVIAGDLDFEGGSGFANNGGGYSYNIGGVNVSNIKVRLLKCEGNDPIPNEELIDFETYIMGVVYAENANGSYESFKAQAVAARSYSLTRAKEMGGAYGLSLKEENGQWILSIRNCTYDQVFCNPDKGCWSIAPGGQTGNGYSADKCTVYSGSNPPYNHKTILSENSDIRKAVEETYGQVLVDKNNNIKYTPYVNTNQIHWNKLAKEGYDYFEILTDTYGTDVRLETPDYSVVEEEGDGVATGVYAHPCPGFTRLSSKFGPRDDPNNPGQPDFHYGIDLAAPTGTKVYAFDGGTIITARGGCVEKDSSCNGYAGNYIEVDHGNGMITRYLHLSKISVSKGQKVSKGQYIGEVGNTGASTGPHLDFKIKLNGNYVNPENYYNFTK